MKRSIITVVAVMLSVTAFAQFTNQGTFLLGGSSNLGLGFLSEKFKLGGGDFQDGSKISNFSFSTQAGYFFVDNLAAGVGLDFSNSKTKNDTFEQTSSSLIFSPFIRYYLEKLYVEGKFGAGSSKSTSNNVEIKSSINAWSVGAGYAILLSDLVTLEPQIGYGSTSYKNKSADSTTKLAGLFINLSLFIYLSK
ncbi:MAG: hypothetical protein DYG99_11965 [Bacteroidetes bacterium CHB5]|nr:hypothetical protein [Bacteroidetes bacterium CHB5]